MKDQPNTRFTAEQLNDLKEKNCFLWMTVSYPSGKKRELYIRNGQIEERASLDMDVVTSIKFSTVLTIHGTNDTTIPQTDGIKYQQLIPNSQLILIEGANHSYSHHRNQVSETIKNWLSTRINNEKMLTKL